MGLGETGTFIGCLYEGDRAVSGLTRSEFDYLSAVLEGLRKGQVIWVGGRPLNDEPRSEPVIYEANPRQG
jgi:hypothetical protein